MNSRARKKGNVTALVVVGIGVVVVLLAFFFLNFNQIFGTHKEAQTAIDGAALQVAKDMCKIVITGNYGQVGLVDDLPGTGTPDNRPVWGINTLLATTRLDSVIANQLGNTTMEFSVALDIQRAQSDANTLATAIMNATALGQTVNDKNGNPINLVANANAAYDANSRRLGKGARVGSVQIFPAQLPAGQGETNIPPPNPITADSVINSNPSAYTVQVNGQTVYKPYVNIPTSVGGTLFNFQFAALSTQPELVNSDPSSLTILTGTTGIPPSVVKVMATEQVETVAPNSPHGATSTTQIQVAAGAQAGGTRITNPSGLFCLSFPQGFPPQTGAGGGGGINFASQNPTGLMNLSQLPSGATTGTPSPYSGGWNPAAASSAHWITPTGGAYPPQAGQTGTTTLVNSNYMGLTNTDPSVTLAFMVYDWLQSMGLRANNVTDVVNSLSFMNKSFQSIPPSANQNTFVGGVPWLQPAYAQSSGTENVRVGGFFTLNPSGVGDPRNVTAESYPGNMTEYQTQYYSSFGYVPALTNMPATTSVTNINATTGAVTTASGAPVQTIPNMWLNGLQITLDSSNYTLANAQTVAATATAAIGTASAAIAKDNADIAAKTQAVQAAQALLAIATPTTAPPNDPGTLQSNIATAQSQISSDQSDLATQTANLQAAQAQLQRAQTVAANATYVNTTLSTMIANMLALSSVGLSLASPGHYILGGADFYPTQLAASTAQIMATGAISAGQASGATPNDWSAPLQNGKSQMSIFHYTNPAIGHHRPDNNSFLQPALAQSSVPSSQVNMYLFTVIDDASTNPGSSGISLTTPPTTPFGNEATLEGQRLYQNSVAYSYKEAPYTITTTSPQPDGSTLVTNTTYQVTDYWQVYARSQNANTTPSDQPGGGAYFGNASASGNMPGTNISPANWCHLASFGNPGGSNTSAACPNMITEWQIRCPIQSTSINGISTQIIPPPPPPHMG